MVSTVRKHALHLPLSSALFQNVSGVSLWVVGRINGVPRQQVVRCQLGKWNEWIENYQLLSLPFILFAHTHCML